MTAPATRILVIGADAADAALIESWGAAGDLPHLMRLRAEGASARIDNPLGLEAGSVWPTFHTGANPGHQPQFDAMRRFDPERYAFDFYGPDEVAPPLWRMLSAAGLRTFVMDTPYSHLEPGINGVSIVDWGAHVPALGTGALQFRAVPAEAAQEILDLVGPDPCGGLMCDDRLPETVDEYRRFLQAHVERIRKKARIARHFLAKGGWDYFEIVFCDLHCVGHHTWHINDPGHPRYRADLEAQLGHPLREAYRALDAAVGEILGAVDRRTLCVFYASHGMGPQYTGTGLLDRILLRLETGVPPGEGGPSLKGRLRRLWRAVPVDWRARLMPIRRHFAGALQHDVFLAGREARQAFEVYCNNSAGGVRVNLKGREACGRVEPPAYEALLAEIEAGLARVVNAETGEPLVKEIVRVHERFPGPHAQALPDLAVIWNKAHPIRVVRSPEIGTLWQEFADARTGDHTPYGMVLAAGPGVRPGALNHAVTPADFVPTFRAALGLAPGASDGQPIAALLARPRAVPGKVETGFPSGTATDKDSEPFIDSEKR